MSFLESEWHRRMQILGEASKNDLSRIFSTVFSVKNLAVTPVKRHSKLLLTDSNFKFLNPHCRFRNQQNTIRNNVVCSRQMTMLYGMCTLLCLLYKQGLAVQSTIKLIVLRDV